MFQEQLRSVFNYRLCSFFLPVVEAFPGLMPLQYLQDVINHCCTVGVVVARSWFVFKYIQCPIDHLFLSSYPPRAMIHSNCIKQDSLATL